MYLVNQFFKLQILYHSHITNFQSSLTFITFEKRIHIEEIDKLLPFGSSEQPYSGRRQQLRHLLLHISAKNFIVIQLDDTRLLKKRILTSEFPLGIGKITQNHILK